MTVLLREDRGAITLLTLNRPDKRNALSRELLESLIDALRAIDRDGVSRAVVLRGDDRAFAAGADLGDLGKAGAIDLYTSGFSELWDDVAAIRTPIIAAVSGYALGGGLELALLCDIVIAAESARFGFPETGLGIIPGAGGTQRVVRAVGKAVAMDLLLTGRRMDADEALRSGLISRVTTSEDLLPTAIEAAERAAAAAPLAARMAKHAVLAAQETGLSAGVAHERALSALIAASNDRAEGMRAFRERRAPEFEGR
ncbi:enoyl-CoA hydratase-related protein [Microbacterium marinilacus]|uniref:Enoyl-CoA hydratase n=1 Tax=Microbacterium marinilacus TaxID=415209 RepID=A0ABP7BU94_9MICO|nr:enoyl-CoA hydratase-related protein [Microbacterium marinilacus]MBY0689119.1 enoyl-CoA hydratase/isomerase family protein [Microbacterium marinilacus]